MNPEDYGFVKIEIDDAQMNIERCYRYEKDSLVVAEISEDSGEQLLNRYLNERDVFGSGLSGSKFQNLDVEGLTTENAQCYQELLRMCQCRLLLLVWKLQDEERLLFLSHTRRVRALEFLDYLIAEFGLVKGNAECASGQISSAILSVQIADIDVKDALEYFLRMTVSYYEDCEWLEAATYGIVHNEEIARMTAYYKKKIAWAYVKSIDVVPEGELIRIKSLENESGMLMTADENTYIMIGCRGEVYNITKEKFERTYEVTEEELDIFEQMLDFLPAIERVSDGDYISLDDVARLCYPKQGTGIYACELSHRTKVFPANESTEYFLGRPGDYLAIRLEDFQDIYVIQREIFQQTYEERL